MVRKAAVAGRWYPATSDALAEEVDRYLDAASAHARAAFDVAAIVAPHAGLVYSGPIAAYAYRELQGRRIDVAFLVGPSHFVAFDGVAVDLSDSFDTPLGPAEVDHEAARALMAAAPIVRERPGAHAREHSLEMQLPFFKRVAPSARIVPLLVGHQTRQTAHALGDALAAVARGRSAVLIASTDLSHYHDAVRAGSMDAVVVDHLARGDDEGLQQTLDAEPDHACGGGPTVAVLRAARLLGATRAAVLKYGDSGDISGDKSSVVGYVAAAVGYDERG